MPQPNFNGFMQPMEGTGAEQDLLTGFPSEILRETRSQREEQRQHEREQRTWLILQDLEGQGGEVVRRLLALTLERVRYLAATDQELSILLGVLGSVLGAETATAERVVREGVMDMCASILRLESPPALVGREE